MHRYIVKDSHNNCHRKYVNGPDISINTNVRIDLLTFASHRTHVMNNYYFVPLGIFMCQGHRTQR